MLRVRKLFVGVLSLVFLVSLLGTAFTASISHTFSNPVKIEGWLNQSNLYESFIDKLASDTQKSLSSSYQINGLNNFIKPAIVSAFPKSVFNQDVNTIINNNYLWLEGHSSSPNFKIDLSTVKHNLNDGINRFVQTQISALPNCTKAQLLQLQPSNPLALGCKPPSIDLSSISAQLISEVDSGSTVLSNAQITAANLSTKNTPHSLYYQKYPNAPSYYQWYLKMPWLLASLAIICALGILFCSARKRRGIKNISIILLISGIILIVIKAVTGAATNQLRDAIRNNSQLSTFHQVLINLFNKIETSIAKVDLEIGVLYVILALILIILLLVLRRKSLTNKPPVDNSEAGKPGSNQENVGSSNTKQSKVLPISYVDSISPIPSQSNSSSPSSAPLLKAKPKSNNRGLIQ